MITCDLCGQAKECLQKEIDGREYDVCSDCWNSLEQKLRGKGRMKKETVFLPPPQPKSDREDEEVEPPPGGPPKIWGAASSLLSERSG